MSAELSSPKSRRSRTPRIPLPILVTILVLLGLLAFAHNWTLRPPGDFVHKTEEGKFGTSLSWQGADIIKTFSLYRADSATGPWTMIAVVGGNQYTDMNISTGMTYYYQVRSRGLLAEGNAAQALRVTIPETITWTWDSGNSYSGTFFNGKMCGQGSFTWLSGSKYTGNYTQGQAHGDGLMIWANGDRYEGEFLEGLPHGHGIYYWANGDAYSGDFVAGQRSGQGLYTWACGYRYEGQWQNNQRHGQGQYWSASNRLLKKGLWMEGEFVGSQN